MAKLAQLMLMAALQVTLCGAALWAVRALFKDRLAARWRVAAWLVLAVRLLVPVSLALPEAPIQLPVYQIMEQGGAAPMAGNFSMGAGMAGQVPTPAELADQQAVGGSADGQSDAGTVSPWRVAFWGWAVGVLLLLGWQAAVRLRFAWKLRGKRLDETPDVMVVMDTIALRLRLRRVPRVYRTGAVAGPVLAGVFRPKVLLPENAGREAMELALWHELCHLKRGDLLAKQVFTLCAVLYWPNPFVHLMARLAGQDMELACDEKVLRMIGREKRGGYAEAIVQAVRGARWLPSSVSGFSSDGRLVRRRLKALFSAPARRVGAVVLPVTLALVVLAGCMVGPAASGMEAEETQRGDVLDQDGNMLQQGREVFAGNVEPPEVEYCPVTAMAIGENGVRQVWDEVDLFRVGLNKEALAFEYVQMRDIRVTTEWTLTIGEEGDGPFTGSYDGNGFAIVGLSAEEGESMFGYAEGAVIQNITLRDPKLPEGMEEQSAIVGSASGCVIKENRVVYSEFDGAVDVQLLGMPIEFYTGGDKHPYISFRFRNDSSEAMVEASFVMAAFDRYGQPLEVAWFDVMGNTERSFINIVEGVGLYHTMLKAGEEYETTGGWSLTDGWHGGEDTDVAYVIATIGSIEFESGMWRNPELDAWREKWEGKPAAVEELEGYYPHEVVG